MYLIIGSGKIARHFAHYFDLLKIPYLQWSRSQPGQLAAQQSRSQLSDLHSQVDRTLLLISDSAIGDFVDEHPFLKSKTLIHFSGSLSIPGVVSWHPLMTFSSELYNLETYQTIPFVTTDSQPISQQLPGLQNAFYKLEESQKPLYHALCVLGGNFSTLLIGKMISRFETDLGLPRHLALRYLEQVFSNAFTLADPLTGPLARKDNTVITKNLHALAHDPYEKIYRSFVEIHHPQYKETQI
mgnify:CR=1 FL=1